MPHQHHLTRAAIAVGATLTFVAAGSLARIVPTNVFTCLSVAYLLFSLLLATAASTLVTRSYVLRFIIGAVVAAGAAKAINLGWDDLKDELFPLNSDVRISVIALLFSFAPVYHMIRIEGRIHTSIYHSWRSRLLHGAVMGCVQASFIALIVGIMLWWLLPIASGLELPAEVRAGPAREGRLTCVVVLMLAITIAGIIGGILAALCSAIPYREAKRGRPPG